MRKLFDCTLIPMAIAIFSMFFGAGNAIFPLILGMEAQDQFGWAFFGLMITAIGGPLLGLVGATLFQGRCIDFFFRLGRIPGTILITITLALLGPFAVLPRCITVAYAAITPLFPTLPIWLFALLFSSLTLFCCWQRRFLLPVLCYLLSPILIGCLLLIIYQGLGLTHPLSESTLTRWNAFTLGLSTGYDTMDLIASIYFSAGIWNMFSIHFRNNPPMILKATLKSGALGCLLLGLIYFGLAHAAARFSLLLTNVPSKEIMTQLATLTLGPTLGLVANLAIALACFTTAISLTMTIGDIVCHEILPNRLSYRIVLLLILIITTAMANIGFEAIMHLIHPVISICYPIIIALTIANIVYKLYPNKFKNWYFGCTKAPGSVQDNFCK